VAEQIKQKDSLQEKAVETTNRMIMETPQNPGRQEGTLQHQHFPPAKRHGNRNPTVP
jgi:hypothetical protein